MVVHIEKAVISKNQNYNVQKSQILLKEKVTRVHVTTGRHLSSIYSSVKVII
jgi:hypothetical protein